PMPDRRALLRQTADLAADFLEGLPERPVHASASHDDLLEAFGGPLPARGEAPGEVVSELARIADPGLIASAGPRFFGFVIGGSLPSALAADWLTSAWDNNAGLYVIGPSASVAEEVAGVWLTELFGLPDGSSIGYSTGATMASFTGLAAGRHRVLERAGWNVEEDGLTGAPDIAVVVGAEAHVTIHVSLQMLGLGRNRVYRVEADEQGRMRPDALRGVLAGLRDRPVLVSAQAGNVNTGAFDPLPAIVAAVRELPNAWLHVDGAFGLWAAVSPELRHLTAGLGDADSWTTDAHKWLNVPYDSGIVIVRDVAAHHAAMTLGAAYYVETAGGERDPYNWVAESSRRARGFPIYAALRELGRDGLVEMIERCCRVARRMADGLRDAPGVTILNDVVLNQVLVRFAPPSSAAGNSADPATIDAFTREVIAEVQRDGTCWLGGTTWHGMAAMRISVSNWSTSEADGDVSVAAIRRCAERVGSAVATG
ncbi:MAG TPA: aminotransferase class V-fold PLP-dependent enzyme, partial [Candidatus Limnocylindrales bacterium]|nr:aminotransferase class V-fold PLP-dependent enzyme [Candidatus Limnocylindrales bacterium]